MLLKKFWRETQQAFQELAHAEQQPRSTANEMTLQQIFITGNHLFLRIFKKNPTSRFLPVLSGLQT